MRTISLILFGQHDQTIELSIISPLLISHKIPPQGTEPILEVRHGCHMVKFSQVDGIQSDISMTPCMMLNDLLTAIF